MIGEMLGRISEIMEVVKDIDEIRDRLSTVANRVSDLVRSELKKYSGSVIIAVPVEGKVTLVKLEDGGLRTEEDEGLYAIVKLDAYMSIASISFRRSTENWSMYEVNLTGLDCNGLLFLYLNRSLVASIMKEVVEEMKRRRDRVAAVAEEIVSALSHVLAL